MTAAPSNLRELLLLARDRKPAPPTPSWRNPAWRYADAGEADVSAAIRNLGDLIRVSVERAYAPPVASWRNPAWRYQDAATHADSNAFRLRQQERARRIAEQRQEVQ